MNQTRKNQFLLYGLTLALGGASVWLHRYMMENCFDDKNLLISGTWPELLLWAAGIAMVIGLALVVPRLGGNGEYADSFSQSPLLGGLMAAGGLVLMTVAGELVFEIPIAENYPDYQMVFQWLSVAPAWAAGISMVVVGVCRWMGKKPCTLFSGIVCLFYILMLVTSYRNWSADPRLYSYAYQHLALVLLMLCSFHRACCDAGILQRKKLVVTAMAAAFCAIAALSGETMPRMYLASAFWALGCCCDPAVLPPDPEPEEPKQEQPKEAAETPEQSGTEE